MSRQNKVLEVMSLARLPLEAKIARLVRKWIGVPFDRAQATAVAKCYLDGEGSVPVLARRLMSEKLRQERIQHERRAVARALASYQVSPMNRYRGPAGARNRKLRMMEIAKRTFGESVRANFSEDTLALMSLIEGEDRSYRIEWIDANFRPVRCALIRVITQGRVNPTQTNTKTTTWLIYKINGRVLVLRAYRFSEDCTDAWSRAVPEDFVREVPYLLEDGLTVKSDLEDQQMVVSRGDDEAYRVPFIGRTVDG